MSISRLQHFPETFLVDLYGNIFTSYVITEHTHDVSRRRLPFAVLLMYGLGIPLFPSLSPLDQLKEGHLFLLEYALGF